MAILDLFKKKQEEPKRRNFFKEIASRETAFDAIGMMSLLPSPDPVLRKLEDGGHELLEGLTSDAHVMSVIQTRKLGTLKREWLFQPGQDEKGEVDSASLEICRMFKEDVSAIDLFDVINEILNAPFYGMVPFELEWRSQGGKARLTGIRALPNRWFGFDQENQPRFLSERDGILGESLPYGKFVFARHFPTYDNPYGISLLSRCLWPVTFKKGGIKFWVQLAEKYGMPFLIGTYPAGTTESEQDKLLSSLAGAIRDFVMIAPEGGQVKVEQANAQSGAVVHKELKDAMNDEISKVILGQNLTTEVKEGSYAASKTHAEVLSIYREADQKLVAKVMNRILELYTSINSATARPPKFVWYEEEDFKKSLAERDKILSDQGVNFSKGYYMAQYGLNEADFELKA